MLHVPSRQPPIREPIFNVPLTIAIACGFIISLHALRFVLSDEANFRLLLDLAFIPAQWTTAFEPEKASEILIDVAGQGTGAAAARLALARYVLGQTGWPFWTALSYALVHGSWMHVLLNSVWLAAFGTPVARRCGPWRFWGLAAASALGGAAAHYLVYPLSVLPLIGASAAVSGMMAAAARFVFTEDRRSFGLQGWPGQDGRSPRLRVLALARNSRAMLFIGMWFATNLLFGLAATPLGIADASIAWEAHMGGFIVGLLTFPLVDPAQPAPAAT